MNKALHQVGEYVMLMGKCSILTVVGHEVDRRFFGNLNFVFV